MIFRIEQVKTNFNMVWMASQDSNNQCKGLCINYIRCLGSRRPEEQWRALVNPIFEVELNKLQGQLVEDIAERYRVDEQTAVCYFLIFAMDELGYHIDLRQT